MNLRSVGGAAKGVVNDSIVEQIDIKTGLVMWEWHALGHIPLRDSYSAPPKNSTNWDYVHINSVDPGGSGDVLLSARNTWQIYDVSIHTGGFIWRLGGKFSNFTGSNATRTYWQHDAEWQSSDEDLGVRQRLEPTEGEAEAAVCCCALTGRRTPSRWRRSSRIPSSACSLQAREASSACPAATGCWATAGCRTSPSSAPGAPSCSTARSGAACRTFGTYLGAWSGQPTTRPSLTIGRSSSGAPTAWASWNGATALASWRVLSGSSPAALAPGGSVAKAGFETPLALDSRARYVAVQALDSASGAHPRPQRRSRHLRLAGHGRRWAKKRAANLQLERMGAARRSAGAGRPRFTIFEAAWADAALDRAGARAAAAAA